MTLILDRRNDLGGAPGIHALIGGVSFYRHLKDGDPAAQPADPMFDLKQLTSTAMSAYLFYKWLLAADAAKRLPLPLATVHLLLSPSADELAKEAELAKAERCSRKNFVTNLKEWRSFANDADAMTVLYFAGHGVQRRQNDSVLLLDDFGDPDAGGSLVNTAEVAQIIAGMAPPSDLAKKIANRQLYFLDACRMPDKEFQKRDWMNTGDLWNIDKNSRDDRSQLIFYAAIPGSSAFAVRGGQTLFSAALTDCLDRVAAVPSEDDDARWRVTTASLKASIQSAVDAVNLQHSGEQQCLPITVGSDIVIAYFDESPPVDCEVRIDPDTAAKLCSFSVTAPGAPPAYQIDKVTPNPLGFNVKGGFYTYDVQPADATLKPFKGGTIVKPRLPRFQMKVKVGG
ncbi:MAG: hypothetical protein DMF56_09790 [Acidobacteria bacterium]|nr:MAG: hypothetical protein DMF56_09790 [Acidobacteriota bacterium]